MSRYYLVSVNDMLGASRVREVLVPRQTAMYTEDASSHELLVAAGEIFFSNRDHTTVMHAVSKIETKMQDDPQLLREIRAIEQELGLGR